MVYTDIQTLGGLTKPADYGSGVEYANGLIEIFHNQSVAMQIGLWLSGASGCRNITNGNLNDKLDALVAFLDDIQAPQIFLRIGYEFDNPYFGYSDDPAAYISAFKMIVDYCRTKLSPLASDKVQYVWHSWAASLSDGLIIEDFYPGDDFVDWIGVSIFQQLYPWSNEGNKDTGSYASWSLEHVENVLKFAINHDKPTMIAESTPFGGINGDKLTANQTKYADSWDRWFQPVFDLIEKYDISMWNYINCDWNSQPMWAHTGFGDSRISSNSKVMAKWLNITSFGQYGTRKFLMSDTWDTSCRNSTTEAVIGSCKCFGTDTQLLPCISSKNCSSTFNLMALAFALGAVVFLARRFFFEKIILVASFCQEIFKDCSQTNSVQYIGETTLLVDSAIEQAELYNQ